MNCKVAFLLAGFGLAGTSVYADEPQAIVPEKHLDLMYDHCMDCHNADTQKGKVNLEDLPLEVNTLQHAELWQKVLDVMNSGEMPPENKRQPEKEAKADFLEDLAKTMVLARKKLSDSGGQITMRRLNRREYHNTIESLTGVSLNVESLPADGGAGSFDTVGASQFISSDQFEQYLELGRTAVDEAFDRHSTLAKPSKVFRVEPENTVNVEHLEMIKKIEERLALVKPWMDSVNKAVKAPENEAIMAQLHEEHPDIDTHAFRIYRMSNRLKGVMELKHFGGDPDSAMNFYQLDYRTKYESLKYFAALPHNQRGTYLRYTSGIVRLDIPSPKERPKLVPGKYKLRFKVGIVEGTPIEHHFIEVGHPRRTSPIPSGFANSPLSVHQVTGTIENPQVIESIVEVSIVGPKEFGIQARMPKDFQTRIQKHHADRRKNGHGTPPALWVDWIELEGPIQDGAVQTFRVEPEETVNVESAKWMKRLEENHQRYLGWKAGVDKAALDPENQQVLEQIRKKYNITDLNNSIRLYQNADLLKGIPDARNFGFKDSNDASFSFRGGYDRMYAYQKHYAELPLSDRGTYLKLGWGIQRIVISPPADKLVPGEYKLRVRAGAVKGSDPNRHFIQIGYPQRNNDVPAGLAGKPISGHQVNGTTENPEIIETIVKIGSGNPNEFAIQERQPEDRDTYRKQFYRIKKENGYGYPPAVWIDWAELEGPIKDKQIIESSITRVDPEKTINPANEKIIKKAEAAQDRFKQWKKGVDEAAKSPENQAIIAEIRKKNRLIDHPNRFYIFAEHFKNVPNPKDFGFLDFQKAAAADPSRSKNLALLKHYASLPHRDTGTYLKLTHGTGRVIVAPKKMPVGDYIFRVRLGTVKGTPAARKFIEIGHPQRDIESRDWGLKGKPISVHQVTGTIEDPQIMEIPIEVRSDTVREFAVQEKQPNNANLKTLWDEHNKFKSENGYGHPPAIWIDWAEIEGPIPKNQVPESTITRVEAEKVINPKQEKFIKDKEKWFERFRQWQKGVDAVVNTPENQAIIAEISKTEKHLLEPYRFYSIADRLKGTPDAKDFGFNDAPNANSANPARPSTYKYFKHYVGLPHRENGAYLMPTKGPGRVVVSPAKLPRGKYTLRARVGIVEGSDPSRHFIQFGHPQRMYDGVEWDYGLKGRSISTHQVTGTIANPQVIEIPIEVGPDTPREFAVQEKQPNTGNAKSLWKTHNAAVKENGFGIPPAIWVDWFELEGPHDPNRPKIWKQRREVEHYATAKVKRKFENYYKAGYEAALAFQKDGIPRPAIGVKDLDEAKFRIRRYEMEAPSQLRYLNDPLTKTGSLLGVFDRNGNLNSEEFIEISMDPLGAPKKSKPLPLGTYRLRVRIGSIEGTSPDRHFAVLGSVSQAGSRNVGGDGFNLLETFQVTGTTKDSQVFETTVELTLDGPRKFSLREKSNLKADTLRGKREIYKNGMAVPPALWIDWVEWEGPLLTDTASAGLISILTENRYGSKDTEEARARKMFHDFCVDAYRQVEPDPKFIDKLMGLLKIRKAAGETFDVAIRTPMSVILASPGFIYLDEPNKEESKRTLNDRELAVRLSYFLWSRPPDSELISLAQRNELSKPEILRQQVNRMITDSRSDDFVSGFVHQWLHMERLDFFQFDTKLHREFDESVRASARKEVYESFALLLRDQEGGHIGKLLKSDYVMINGLLGTYYGIEGVSGDHFRKVSLPPDSPRGGLLGTAAVLAMGSDGIESSPVERGAWVLRYLLNDPPPPAPPNVPQLSRLADKPLTARERVLAHQEEPQCASCHRKIDPIGFGLENFTAAGKWRTEDKHGKKTYDIDPSGKFHKGPEFADYFEMRDLIAQREDDFARGFTEHLIGYGLGRPFGFTDEDLANEIISAAKKEDHSVSAFVHALVQSKAFITK